MKLQLPVIIPIPDINKFQGSIPAGYDLVVMEENGNPDDAAVLYGFDEIGLYDSMFRKPVYAFLSYQLPRS